MSKTSISRNRGEAAKLARRLNWRTLFSIKGHQNDN